MNLAKRNEVIKASPAIQIQSRITLLQRRAWNVLLANAYDELPDKDIHHVSVAELAAKLGFNSGNREQREAMKWNLSGTFEGDVGSPGVLSSEMEFIEQRQGTEMGVCESFGIRRNRKRRLHVCIRAPSAPQTLQPACLRQVEPAFAKPVQEPVCVGFVGNLFRLF